MKSPYYRLILEALDDSYFGSADTKQIASYCETSRGGSFMSKVRQLEEAGLVSIDKFRPMVVAITLEGRRALQDGKVVDILEGQ